jgi:hypothetical protein
MTYIVPTRPLLSNIDCIFSVQSNLNKEYFLRIVDNMKHEQQCEYGKDSGEFVNPANYTSFIISRNGKTQNTSRVACDITGRDHYKLHRILYPRQGILKESPVFGKTRLKMAKKPCRISAINFLLLKFFLAIASHTGTCLIGIVIMCKKFLIIPLTIKTVPFNTLCFHFTFCPGKMLGAV